MGHVRDLPKKKLGVDVDQGFAATTRPCPPARRRSTSSRRPRRPPTPSTWPPTPTARARPSAGTSPRSWAARPRSPRPIPSGRLQRDHQEGHPGGLRGIRRKSTRRRSTPSRPAASWTAWWATRSAPSSGRRCGAGLSAGRVQSVALKLVCDREREIKAFEPEEYWTVQAHLQAGAAPGRSAPTSSRRTASGPTSATRSEADAVRKDLEAADLPRRQGPGPRAQAPAGAPLHHLQAAAGRLPQAALPGAQDHAGRAEAVRGHRARRRRQRPASSPTCGPTRPGSPATPSPRCASRSRPPTARTTSPTSPTSTARRRAPRTPTRPSAPPT